MADFVTPRVNQALLSSFVGKNVRVVGQVQQQPSNGVAVLLASDNAPVTVKTQAQSEETWTDQYMEVIGKVAPDLSIEELFSTNFGNNFDLDNHNALVIFSHNHYEIFM
mmetsp:Transcript_61199/g.92543  ORF Transcript_61199/g.92543 Transcript_61199/m.92543 type:complete len:109 (+) Transcript_61199:3-329(+)